MDTARIATNLADTRQRIADAAAHAGRSVGDIRLVAVTKTVGLAEVQALYDLGVRDFGENRLHVAQPKIEAFDADDAVWHMIGPLQRRKARDVAALFQSVDAVDRVEVGEALDQRCQDRPAPLPVFVEVNVSGEESKHGFTATALPSALDRIRSLEYIEVKGLMTMAPFVDDPEEARPVFAGLRALAEAHGLTELSMGMSNDFEIAIEEGATQVRIGSLLFA
ncbi:MAG: YggS family pyridoxal phosphate-dependent enzyme [bacterium]|nr:YggS family pyridoxal phosphate-dependent enzyme [bacterium]